MRLRCIQHTPHSDEFCHWEGGWLWDKWKKTVFSLSSHSLIFVSSSCLQRTWTQVSNFYFLNKQTQDRLIKFSSLSQVFLANISRLSFRLDRQDAGLPGLKRTVAGLFSPKSLGSLLPVTQATVYLLLLKYNCVTFLSKIEWGTKWWKAAFMVEL